MKSGKLGGTVENWRPDFQDENDPANGSAARSWESTVRSTVRMTLALHTGGPENDQAHRTSGRGSTASWLKAAFALTSYLGSR